MFMPHVKFLYAPHTGVRRRSPAWQLLGQSEGKERQQISHGFLISPIIEIATLQGAQEYHAIHPEPFLRATLE